MPITTGRSSRVLLYETWWDKSRSEEPDPETMLRTCTITTNVGADMVDVHNRMPVIIERPDFDRWLDPDQHDTGALSSLPPPLAKAPWSGTRSTRP